MLRARLIKHLNRVSKWRYEMSSVVVLFVGVSYLQLLPHMSGYPRD